MSKITVIYQNLQDDHLVLDSREEKSEMDIIRDVSRLSGASPGKIRKLIKKYKAEFMDSYQANQLEDYVLNAVHQIRRVESCETIST